MNQSFEYLILCIKILLIRIEVAATFHYKVKKIKKRLINDTTVPEEDLERCFLEEIRVQIKERADNKVKELECKHKERFGK